MPSGITLHVRCMFVCLCVYVFQLYAAYMLATVGAAQVQTHRIHILHFTYIRYRSRTRAHTLYDHFTWHRIVCARARTIADTTGGGDHRNS